MRTIYFLCSMLFVLGCIGDDIIDDRVPPTFRFSTCVDTLGLGQSFQLQAKFYNNLGQETATSKIWHSDNPEVLSISGSGLITGLMKGSADVLVIHPIQDFYEEATTRKTIIVDDFTIIQEEKSGTIVTTSSYQLEGTFSATQSGDDLLLSFNEDFKASTALPGLYLYMTNNPTTNAGALEVKAVDVFSGAHEITVPDTDINEYQFLLYYCKPFSVKVGEGELE